MTGLSKEIFDIINKWFDEIIQCYQEDAEEEIKDSLEYKLIMAKIEAMQELKTDLNEPKPIINVSENIQQTVNVQEAKNIINNEL
jgi:hypothetical protein